jgi:predicted DNA-binding protein (MmcQ/YjbR family)
MKSLRQAVIDYIRTKYKDEIEYPWMRYPDYGVFRHKDNQKWYGLMMDVPREKLGLKGKGIVDILNIKLGDFLTREFLIQRAGFFPGYHIARGNWISILLDGTVELEEVCHLIDVSYQMTASAKTKKAIRPPKEWIIPSNPKYYDSVHAFDHTDEIEWKQGAGIKKDDIVFMYVGLPVSAVLYKCVVTETDIPYDFHSDSLTIKSLMKIKLLRKYPQDFFTFERLKTEFGIFAVRGPRGIPDALSKALK